jgi:hypothetical protein
MIEIRSDGTEWQRCISLLYFHAPAARRARAAGKQKSCNQHEEYEGNEC